MDKILTHGFLGYDASFMLDFVVCSLILVVPWLLFSLYLVKFQRKYKLHRTLQVLLGLILLVAVTAFEVDMRLHGGWEKIVNKSQASPRLNAEEIASVQTVLYVHLVFAISTPFLWIATLYLAWKRFAKPPVPAVTAGCTKLSAGLPRSTSRSRPSPVCIFTTWRLSNRPWCDVGYGSRFQ